MTRCGCGRQTNNGSGVCIICEKFNVLNETVAHTNGKVKSSLSKEKEEKMAIGCKNEIEGKPCGRPVQKEGLCYACYTKVHGKAPYGKATATVEKKGKLSAINKQPSVLKAKGQAAVKPEKYQPDIIEKLLMRKDELQGEIIAIDLAILTIGKLEGRAL